MAMPGAFVIFGATGDLARRMLFPSLYFLDADGLLPCPIANHWRRAVGPDRR
jgi:glucose-6-phosphate 1-dehydrogenase